MRNMLLLTASLAMVLTPIVAHASIVYASYYQPGEKRSWNGLLEVPVTPKPLTVQAMGSISPSTIVLPPHRRSALPPQGGRRKTRG
jgi:hypothetical protein